MKFLSRQNHKIKIWWNQQLKTPTYYPFVMEDSEKNLLKKYISASRNYLEFGLGGSTIYSLLNSNAKIISIDTNVPWIDFMKAFKVISINLKDRLKIEYINIGPTKNWGFPIDESQAELFPDFSSKPFTFYDANEFDTILVDGRFRVACVLSSIIHRTQNKHELRILIHDYSFREEYKIVEKYLNIVESAKSLFVFRIKDTYDEAQLLKDYNHYKFIAD